MPCLEGRWWVWRETWCRRRDGCGPGDRNLALCHHLSPHQVPVGADSYHTILDGCEKAGQASHHGSEQSFCLGWPGVTAASHPGQQRTPSSFLRETLHPPCCLARGPQCRDETATNRGPVWRLPFSVSEASSVLFGKEKNPSASKQKHKPKSYNTNRRLLRGWEEREPSARPPLPGGGDRCPAQSPWHRSASCLAPSGAPCGGREDWTGTVAADGREEAGAGALRAPSPGPTRPPPG